MDKTPKEMVDATLTRLFELAGLDKPKGQRLDNMLARTKRELREIVKMQGFGIPHSKFNQIFG